MARRNSNSGVLWQVLAPWIRWPLASPRRLGMVLAGVVAAALLVSYVHGRSSAQSNPAGSDCDTHIGRHDHEFECVDDWDNSAELAAAVRQLDPRCGKRGPSPDRRPA